MLFSGCCAVSVAPPVWMCVRSFQRVRILRAEALAQQPRPHASQRAVLRDLLEEVVVRVEDPRDARRHLVDVDAGALARLHVRDRVGEREADLLRRRRAGVADVVAADADAVELRRVARAVGDQVRRQPQRLARRIDVRAARDVLLQHVVLRRAHDVARRHALLLCHDHVHRDEHGRGRVDRHRRAHAVERDAGEHLLHVRQRVDRDADLPDFRIGVRVVGVHADLRRQVERDRETGLPLPEQELEPLVGLGRRAEAGVLAHRPEAAAVHRRLHAARVRILARH